MDRQAIARLILEVVRMENAFDELERRLAGLDREQISNNLLFCGIIPEMFAHSSSEEKLWAKYCDILVSRAFTELGIESRVLRARGDAADVFGQADSYTIVADAKAFRLSRTAKNQKDFKVTALDDWRRQNTFACLIVPFYQCPFKKSQIYEQAESRNVTLLGYIHLKFLLDCERKVSLQPLWEFPKSLTPSKSASEYWNGLDSTVLKISGKSQEDLRTYKQLEIAKTKEIGQEGIEYWQSKMQEYQLLTKEEAVKKLIEAEKIEEKINEIRNALRRMVLL